MFFIIFSSFGCILPFLPCLHPSIISSSPLSSSFCLLCSDVISPRHLLPPLLCLFAVSLRWREWKHRWPAANMHGRSAAAHAQIAGSWKWLSVYIWKRFPCTYSGYHRLPNAYRGKDSFHLHKPPECGCDYCKTWRWPVAPTPNSFPLTFLTSLPRVKSFPALCWSILQLRFS